MRSPGLPGEMVPDVPETEVPDARRDEHDEFRRSLPMPSKEDGGPKNTGDRVPRLPWHRIK